eukprot:3282233-Prymnesium_polylepis.1
MRTAVTPSPRRWGEGALTARSGRPPLRVRASSRQRRDRHKQARTDRRYLEYVDGTGRLQISPLNVTYDIPRDRHFSIPRLAT